MTLPPVVKISTELLWRGALLFASLDLILVSLLVWRVKPATFRQLKWELILVTAVFWGALWFWAVGYYWELVYQYLFPGWSRWYLPFFQAALTALAASLAWRLSWRMCINPVLAYCLLGGLWGFLTHLWAVHMGVVDKPPFLQGAAPISAVVIAIFEFIFYWCVIILLALLVRFARSYSRFNSSPKR